MLVVLVAMSALAAIPEGVTPVAAPPDAPAQYAAWAAKAARPGTLACDSLWPDQVLLCFRVAEDGKRRWVTDADLTAWNTDLPGLRTEIAGRGLARLASAEQRPVDGMPADFWTVRDGDGWAVAGLLHPKRLIELAGGPVLAGMPTDGILVWWRAGDADLDRIMAVAITEMAAADGLSTVVHRWDGRGWRAFGEAKKQ